MGRRPRMTELDYMTIALSPALIMTLIGSLVYFLLEVIYSGAYPERLHFSMAMFVFGAVLVCRISLEDGWDHAAPYGFALSLVVFAAMQKFIKYQGSDADPYGGLINSMLMGVIWFCAYKLTWDATLIDDTEDSTGEGLLQTVGLDRPEDETSAAQPAEAKDADGTTARDAGNWWNRFTEGRRRPHTPGVWVVYFSLAALPIFGIGQLFIPPSDLASRRYAFLLLCVYVASGLGLLMTTSFLGLRRYLRQRRLEMPLDMAGVWLVLGCFLTAFVLLFAALLPRPNPEYSISQLPFTMGSEDQEASSFAVGDEGTQDDEAVDAARTSEGESKSSSTSDGSGGRSDGESEGSGAQGEQSAEADSSTSKGAEGQSQGDSSSRDGSQGGGSSKGSSSDGSASDGSASEGSSSEGSTSEGSDGSQAQEGESARSSDQASGSNADGGENAGSSEASQQDPEAQQDAEASGESSSGSDASVPPPPPVGTLGEELSALKWLFYAAVILGIIWYVWHSRDALLAWVQDLFERWRNFWDILLGRKPDPSDPYGSLTLSQPRQRSFAEFVDPFLSGQANRYSTSELIRYTFVAFEVWARERGVPRAEDQTPYEFARQVGTQIKPMQPSARILAELYTRVAYAADAPLPADAPRHLTKIWHEMRSESRIGAAS